MMRTTTTRTRSGRAILKTVVRTTVGTTKLRASSTKFEMGPVIWNNDDNTTAEAEYLGFLDEDEVDHEYGEFLSFALSTSF